MDSYNGKDLVRYLGSPSSAAGLLLFYFGAAGLLISLIALSMGFSQHTESKAFLAIPIWSAGAVPLGVAMRRTAPATVISIVAYCWLAVGLGTISYSRYIG